MSTSTKKRLKRILIIRQINTQDNINFRARLVSKNGGSTVLKNNLAGLFAKSSEIPTGLKQFGEKFNPNSNTFYRKLQKLVKEETEALKGTIFLSKDDKGLMCIEFKTPKNGLYKYHDRRKY